MISPFAYLSGTSEEQYAKYLIKDTYGYLRRNRETVIDVLSVACDVESYFSSLTPMQVRQMYTEMVDTLLQDSWSINDIRHKIQAIEPSLSSDKVRLIARNEVNRILFYVKEHDASERSDLDQLYVWGGPLDERMTPLCRFMQTGELKGMDSLGRHYDYENLRSQLPEWKEGGYTLPELKQMCRDVHTVFYNAGVISTQMISDWQMHIGCRHTFHPVSRIAEPLDKPVVFDNYIQMDTVDDINQEMTAEFDGLKVLGGMADSQEIYVQESIFVEHSFACLSSIYDSLPSYYVTKDYSEDNVFVFNSLDEHGIGKWLRFIRQEMDAGMDIYNIVFALKDESRMSNEEIGFLVNNKDWMYDFASMEGWFAY